MGAGRGRGEGRYTGKKCRLVSMFSLTVAFFLVEIVVGIKADVIFLLTNNISLYVSMSAGCSKLTLAK